MLLEASLPMITLEQYLRGTRYVTPQRLAWHATGDIEHPSGEALGAAFDAHYIALVDDRTAGSSRDPKPRPQDSVRRHSRRRHSWRQIPGGASTCGEYARKVCEANGTTGAMAAVVGVDEVPDVKPSPLGLLSLCERLGWDPATCVYVGTRRRRRVTRGADDEHGCTCLHDADAQAGRFDALVDTVQELEALLLPGR